jgi:NAD(P)-dependent dehydrogenase (short-subunit alcohol dehydrogenase family)
MAPLIPVGIRHALHIKHPLCTEENYRQIYPLFSREQGLLAEMVTSEYPEFVSFTKTWHSAPYPLISATRPELSASGKNVVVAGGGTGIGQATAISFARAGAKSVSVIGRRVEPLQQTISTITENTWNKTNALYEVADIRVRETVNKALGNIVEKVGKVDILVSSAGFLPKDTPVTTSDPAVAQHAFEINVLGTLNVMQSFAIHAGPSPTLIHVSSGTVHTRPIVGQGIYNATKLAALKLVDQFSAENPTFHVVSLHPGWVATEINGMQAEAPDSRKFPFSLPGSSLLRANKSSSGASQ